MPSYCRYLAEVFHIPVKLHPIDVTLMDLFTHTHAQVVVTNQVTAVGGVSHDAEKESDWSGGSGGGHVTAALGNTWAHCVNIRLLLNHPTESQQTVSSSSLYDHSLPSLPPSVLS